MSFEVARSLLRVGVRMALVVAVLIPTGSAWADSSLDEARRFFAQFVRLERDFDLALIDLYASDAVIRIVSRHPDGEVDEIDIPGAKYQELLRAALPIAKLKGDTNEYRDVSYHRDGFRIRIDASRYSNVKQHASPMSLLVGPDERGRWRIFEATLEMRP